MQKCTQETHKRMLPEWKFQMALLLVKQNNCTKLGLMEKYLCLGYRSEILQVG